MLKVHLRLLWHPRNAVLASAGKDGCVRLWQLDPAGAVTMQANVSLLDNESRGWVEHLGWRPDGMQLAMASGSQVIVCSVIGVVEQAYKFPGGTVGAISWRPVGAQLAAAGYGGVRIYSVLDSIAKPHDLKWKGSLLSLHWSPDAKVIAAGCQDNTVHFWRMPSGKDAAMTGFIYKPLQAAWTPNGKWLVTGGSPLLILWPFDKSGPEGRSPLTIEWHEQAICALGVAPRSGWLATASRGGRLALWRRAGDANPRAWASLDSRVGHLQWSPRKGSALLAVGSREVSGV